MIFVAVIKHIASKNADYGEAERMKQLRNITGFNRAEFARQQGIPLRTIEEWEAGRRKMPEYVLRLLAYKIQLESK